MDVSMHFLELFFYLDPASITATKIVQNFYRPPSIATFFLHHEFELLFSQPRSNLNCKIPHKNSMRRNSGQQSARLFLAF